MAKVNIKAIEIAGGNEGPAAFGSREQDRQRVNLLFTRLSSGVAMAPIFLDFEMKEIPLTQGRVVLVDDEDFELVSRYKWHAARRRKTCYAVTEPGPGRCAYRRMHSLIMGARPGQQIDHIDGNGLNNQRHNLRFATNVQNAANRGRNRNNTSGYKGVFKIKKRWMSLIMAEGRLIYLGTFGNKEDAARAYDEAARKYHGEFARTNF